MYFQSQAMARSVPERLCQPVPRQHIPRRAVYFTRPHARLDRGNGGGVSFPDCRVQAR